MNRVGARARRRAAILVVTIGAVTAIGTAWRGEVVLAGGPAPDDRLTGAQAAAIVEDDSRRPRFDGSLFGWRILPPDAFHRGSPAASDPGCTPVWLDPGVPTELDVVPGSLPQGAGPAIVSKLRCGDRTRFVVNRYGVDTTYGEGHLMIERRLVDRPSFAMQVTEDRVATGTVGGHPAVFAYPLDRTGYGPAEILVLERPVFDPSATIVHLAGDNLRFSELARIAEEVVR